MKRSFIIFSFLLFFFFLLQPGYIFAKSDDEENEPYFQLSKNFWLNDYYIPLNKNQYFLSIRRSQGSVIGVNRSYTTVEAFGFPIRFQNLWPFYDIRYHAFDSGNFAANM